LANSLLSWDIAKFSLILVAASLLALWGIVGAYDSVYQWTAPPFHCPPPRPDSGCVPLISTGGPSTGEEFGIGLGGVAVGVCLFFLAERVRRRQVPPATD
jgi:hypothetical protein